MWIHFIWMEHQEQIALFMWGLFIPGFTYLRSMRIHQNSVFVDLWLNLPRLFAVFEIDFALNEIINDKFKPYSAPHYSQFQYFRYFHGTCLLRITRDASTKNNYYLWHSLFAVLIFAVLIIRILWNGYNSIITMEFFSKIKLYSMVLV